MKNLALRCLIAVVCVWILWLLVPLVLHALGLTLTSDIEGIFKIVVALVALYYIVWGPPPSFPVN